MLRALLLATLVALAFVPAASASKDIDDLVDSPLLKCDGNGVCIFHYTYGTETCAGVGLGLQGAGVCADKTNGCAFVLLGFNREGACVGGSIGTLP